MLEISDLHVSYGAIKAVQGISINVDKGELVGLLGPNGAGKSSVLRASSGLAPYVGTVTFDGHSLSGRTPERIARGGLLHVPEGRHVFPTLSVNENLLLGRRARSKRSATFDLDEIYDLFPNLQRMRTRGGWALSGGEQQMVAIGRALMGSPQILLLDEPSLGLAPSVAWDVMEALKRVTANMGVLIVEQNTSLALAMCERAYVQVDGKIVLQGTAHELSDRQEMLDSFLGQRIEAESTS